ncbi:hypothetical protein B0H11DRAFT_2228983 [Mycena galericulata]|nr:hypothetical protein B0H11DRAFT_1939400 [Mycena galericulata]KAJ7491462.1 hypothetical protein B0H11DRAFT_2228983 [Mycena galericulata]
MLCLCGYRLAPLFPLLLGLLPIFSKPAFALLIAATGIPRITRTFLAVSRRGFTTSGGCSFHSCAQPLAPVAATSTLSKAALYAAVLEDDEDDNTESDGENSERTD